MADGDAPPTTVYPTASFAESLSHPAVPLALGVGTIVACCAVAIASPTDSGPPLCPSKAIFGVDCPLCGATRAVSSLVRGNLLNALDHNIILTVSVPFVVIWWALWMARSLRSLPPPKVAWNRAATITVSILAIAFTIVRNLDATPWMTWLGADLY